LACGIILDDCAKHFNPIRWNWVRLPLCPVLGIHKTKALPDLQDGGLR